MAVVFEPILKQMASGDMQKICAQAALSVDQEKISWDGMRRYAGTIAIYSRNEVELAGTVTALHPAVFIKESTFQGNTTLHYELIPGKYYFLEEQQTEGILICYNGGEYVIPLYFKPALDTMEQPMNSTKIAMNTPLLSSSQAFSKMEDACKKEEAVCKKSESYHRKKNVHLFSESATRKERIARMHLTQLLLKQITFRQKGQADTLSSELLNEVTVQIKVLLQLKPACMRYKLYEAFCVLISGDLRYASALESQLRSTIIASKKQAAADYCVLLYLQYYIARESRQIQEAGVRKQQLGSYLFIALEQEPKDPDLIWILCSDCLDFIHTEPLELWETLMGFYQEGNNSPYLFFFGAVLLQNPEVSRMLEVGIDFWTGRCLYEAVKRGIATPELAEQAAQSLPERYSVLICRMYQMLYEQFPSRMLLASLCKCMIRCDRRNQKSFQYYEQAVEQDVKIVRLYDYYIDTLPIDYEEAINREVLLYFSLDDAINPQIYKKLCLNVLRFYVEDPQIYQEYTMNLLDFLKSRMMRHSWDRDLVLLADQFLTKDRIDQELAQALLPMLYYVQVKAQLPDKSQVIFKSGIYKEPQVGIFKHGMACLDAPGGNGTFRLQLPSGETMESTSMTVGFLIQNEDLRQVCEELCSEDETLLLFQTYAEISRKAYHACDFSLCIQYLKREDLDASFRKQLLDFIMKNVQAHPYEAGIVPILCQCADLMDTKQLALLIELLIQKGCYTEAIEFLTGISPVLVNPASLCALADALVQYPENQSNLNLIRLLWYLLEKELLNDSLIIYLAENFSGSEGRLRKLYRICQAKKLSSFALGKRLLLRILLKGDVSQQDMHFLQELFLASLSLLEGESEELLKQAALHMICYCYLYGWCQLEAETAAVLQNQILRIEGEQNLSLPYQLAFLKYDEEIGFSHRWERILAKKICQLVLKQGIRLDFVQRRAAMYGLYTFPVLQADLSECGDFGKNVYAEVQNTAKSVWAEYYVQEETKCCRIEMQQAYDFLYTAGIVLFAGETAHYRFRFEDQVTDWKEVVGWEFAVKVQNRDMMMEKFAAKVQNRDMMTEKFAETSNREMLDQNLRTEKQARISDRYGMLQGIALSLQKGESAAEAMREYEKMLKMVERIGKEMK